MAKLVCLFKIRPKAASSSWISIGFIELLSHLFGSLWERCHLSDCPQTPNMLNVYSSSLWVQFMRHNSLATVIKTQEEPVIHTLTEDSLRDQLCVGAGAFFSLLWIIKSIVACWPWQFTTGGISILILKPGRVCISLNVLLFPDGSSTFAELGGTEISDSPDIPAPSNCSSPSYFAFSLVS